MVCYSPTLIPTPPPFPQLLARIPHAYPTPLPPRKPLQAHKFKVNFHERRDWAKELDDLSEEEEEFEELTNDVQHRGQTFLIPIGRTLTQHDEKTDAQGEGEDSDESDQDGEGNQDGENAEAAPEVEQEAVEEADLDAEMEDFDQDGEMDDEGDDGNGPGEDVWQF